MTSSWLNFICKILLPIRSHSQVLCGHEFGRECYSTQFTMSLTTPAPTAQSLFGPQSIWIFPPTFQGLGSPWIPRSSWLMFQVAATSIPHLTHEFIKWFIWGTGLVSWEGGKEENEQFNTKEIITQLKYGLRTWIDVFPKEDKQTSNKKRILNISNYERNANQNHNEISPQDSYSRKNKWQVLARLKLAPSHTVGENTKWSSDYGKQCRGSSKK